MAHGGFCDGCFCCFFPFGCASMSHALPLDSQSFYTSSSTCMGRQKLGDEGAILPCWYWIYFPAEGSWALLHQSVQQLLDGRSNCMPCSRSDEYIFLMLKQMQETTTGMYVCSRDSATFLYFRNCSKKEKKRRDSFKDVSLGVTIHSIDRRCLWAFEPKSNHKHHGRCVVTGIRAYTYVHTLFKWIRTLCRLLLQW